MRHLHLSLTQPAAHPLAISSHLAATGHTDLSSGYEWHKDVSQRPVEDRRQEVTHLHSSRQPKMLDLPVDEVIYSFQPPRYRLGHSRAPAREIDVAQLFRLRGYLWISVGLADVFFKADETRACRLPKPVGQLMERVVGDDQGWLDYGEHRSQLVCRKLSIYGDEGAAGFEHADDGGDDVRRQRAKDGHRPATASPGREQELGDLIRARKQVGVRQ